MHVGISFTTFHNWLKLYPEFAYTYELSHPCRQAYCEKILKAMFKGELPKTASATALIFAMKSWFRYDYKEDKEVNIDLNVISKNDNLTLEEAKQKVAFFEERAKLRKLQHESGT